MAEHERATQNKQADVDQKHRTRQHDSQPLFEQFHAWDQKSLPLTETPYYPRMDEHAAILSRIPFSAQRHEFIMQLHQTYGNRYVQRLLESMNVQAKLTISAPGDIYEQEADRVAESVTKTMYSHLQHQAPEEEEEVMTKPASEIQCQVPEEEEEVQMQPAESQPATVSENLETTINAARGNGQPLSEEVRLPMEQAFGADFSGVRVHTDSEAHGLSESLQARAFTAGKDIFFKSGEYTPSSSSGQQLLAHELTHTLQQGATNKIARWWHDGHGLVTWIAARNVKFSWGTINEQVIDFLATRTGDMDARLQNIINMVGGAGIWSPGLILEYKSHQEKWRRAIAKNPGKPKQPVLAWSKDKMKEKWDTTDFQQRLGTERLNHGEGGGYGKSIGGVDANKTRVEKWIMEAVNCLPKDLWKWKSKDWWESLTLLSRALHAAEDRGAHGEGAPWAGHDPRITVFKLDWRGLPNRRYSPEWNPDDPSINSAGWQAAIQYAQEVFENFVRGVLTKFPDKEDTDILSHFGLTPEQRKDRNVPEWQIKAAEKTKDDPKINQMLTQNPRVAELIESYFHYLHELARLREPPQNKEAEEAKEEKEETIRDLKEKLDLCELELEVWTSLNQMGPPGLGKTWSPGQ